MREDEKDWAPLARALGCRVTTERTRLGMTKEELGARSGLASRYVWRVEAGLQNIQLWNIGRLAGGLGITMAELVEGIEALVLDPPDRPPVKRRGPASHRRREQEP